MVFKDKIDFYFLLFLRKELTFLEKGRGGSFEPLYLDLWLCIDSTTSVLSQFETNEFYMVITINI